jgi:hypothetical protein
MSITARGTLKRCLAKSEPLIISGRAGFPVADNGCRPAPRPFHPPPHPFARPAAIDTTRTPDISRRTCETGWPTAFGAADNSPGAETIVRHSCRQFTPMHGQWLSKAVHGETFPKGCPKTPRETELRRRRPRRRRNSAGQISYIQSCERPFPQGREWPLFYEKQNGIFMIWARNANRHRRGEAWIWQQTAMIGMSFALFALSDKSVPMIAEAL